MTTHLRLQDQVCHSLYSATNALVRAYRPLLEPLGLTYPQYLVMLSLWEQDGVGVGALGAHTRLDGGTLTPLLKRLEEKGLVRRERSGEDERRRVITLTDAGRRLRQRAEQVPAQLAGRIDMTAEDAARLKALCETLHRRLTEPD